MVVRTASSESQQARESSGDFIGGAFVIGASDATWTSENPAQDFNPVFRAQQTAAHVDAAIGAARDAQFAWAELSPEARAAHLGRLRDAFAARVDEMAKAIVLETGKPHREARGEAGSLGPRVDLTLSAGLSHVETLRPKGVAGEARAHAQGVLVVLGPYNYPAHLVNAHVIPALATGNTVVIKPTEHCPLVGELYAQCVKDANLPPGVVNLVQGSGDIGRALVAHRDVDGILFTGSYNTGRAIAEACLDHPHKMVALEMGGKNCAVVLDDADLAQALPHLLQGAFLTTGQRCTATSRILVGRGVANSLTEALATATAALAPGDPWDDAAAFGPLANRPAFERFCALRRHAADAGAEVLVEGQTLPGGAFVTPSLHRLKEGENATGYLDEELFGPDLCIEVIDDVDHAIERIGQSAYGLSNAIFTRDENTFERFFARTKSGLLNWNRSTNGASGQLPFGGVGKSGNQRPAGAFATRYTSYPVALLKGDIAAAAPGFEDALTRGARPLSLEVEHLALVHEVEGRLERIRVHLDDIHGATLRFSRADLARKRIGGGQADEVISAALGSNGSLSATHLVVTVPPPGEEANEMLRSLQDSLSRYADENLGDVSTRSHYGPSHPTDGVMPRSSMYLTRMYADNFIPVERKAAVVDHARTVGPWLCSVDAKPLSILDAASQIASLGLGFSADVFLKALDEGDLTSSLSFNADIQASTLSDEGQAQRDAVQAYGSFLLDEAGGSATEEDAANALRHVTFAGGGSEANERAYDLCRVNGEGKRAGGTRVVAFEGSFHGRTMASLHATYNPVKRAPFEIAGYEASFVPFPSWTDPRDEPEIPDAWLTMWADGNTPDDGGDPQLGAEIHALKAVRDEITREDAEKVCCVIVEPFQGEGGDNYATARFFNGLRAVTRRAGIPLVFDEVQSGFGLGGPFFWHRHFQLRDAAGAPEFPDCVTVAKKAQVGVCLSRWEDTRPGAVHVVQAQRGLLHATEIGKLDVKHMEAAVRDRLWRLALDFPDLVENPRNVGYAFAFDLPSSHQANQLIAQRFYRGYMAYIAGERTVRFRLTGAWSDGNKEALFAALRDALLALREGGADWKAPTWIEPGNSTSSRKHFGIHRKRLLAEPRAVLTELVRLGPGPLERVADRTLAYLDATSDDDIAAAVGRLLGDEGLRDAPPREVVAAVCECALEIESSPDPDAAHAAKTEKLGMTPARLLIEALAARVVEITTVDWERVKANVVEIEDETYEEGRRESEEELRGLVFAEGAVSFLAMRRTERGPRAVAYAFGAALENFESDGPMHDVTRGEKTTFYSSNITVSSSARGAGVGQRLKRAQALRVSEIQNPDGSRRYWYLTGRNRIGRTMEMGAINTKLGAYAVEHFRGNQYGDVSGQALYYRIPTQRPRIHVERTHGAKPATSKSIDWASSVQAPLGESPEVLLGEVGAGAFTGPVGTKLTLSNFVSPEVARYCELLHSVAPQGLKHAYFTSARDELVDKGLRALRVKRPNAQRAITFDQQFFGTSTAAARSMTSEEGQAQPFSWYGWPRIPHPTDVGPDAALGALMASIAEVGADKIFGIVVELVGEKTGHVMSPSFLADLDKVRQDTGIPLVFVETASALGRGGETLWMSDSCAVKPDHIWWFAGAQLGHIFVSDDAYVSKPLTLISTWDGDEICAVRTRHHLLEARRVLSQGRAGTFARALADVAASTGIEREGVGLWHALIVGEERAPKIIAAAAKLGLALGTGYGGRIIIAPPLSFSDGQLEDGMKRLTTALQA